MSATSLQRGIRTERPTATGATLLPFLPVLVVVPLALLPPTPDAPPVPLSLLSLPLVSLHVFLLAVMLDGMVGAR